MPQATEEQRQRMRNYFGDIDDFGPAEFLKEQGYKEDRFRWHPKEGVKCLNDMTEKEWDCLSFLQNEWDWGGLIVPGEQP